MENKEFRYNSEPRIDLIVPELTNLETSNFLAEYGYCSQHSTKPLPYMELSFVTTLTLTLLKTNKNINGSL